MLCRWPHVLSSFHRDPFLHCCNVFSSYFNWEQLFDGLRFSFACRAKQSDLFQLLHILRIGLVLCLISRYRAVVTTSWSQVGSTVSVVVKVWTLLTTWTSAFDHDRQALVKLRRILPYLEPPSLETVRLTHSQLIDAKVCSKVLTLLYEIM